MPIKDNDFSISKKSLLLYEKLNNRLLSSDLILMLLMVAPIKGMTKMQKQVFLTWKELFNDISVDPGYYPWKYGAYSKVVENTIRILEKQRLVETRKRKGEGTIFEITKSGRNMIKNKIRTMKFDLKTLTEKKTDWDDWTPRGTLRYVYRNYPEYTSKTNIPSLKW